MFCGYIYFSLCNIPLIRESLFLTSATCVFQNMHGRPQDLGGGGCHDFYFRFVNFLVAKRHAARIARGVRGHPAPRIFFKTVQFGAF